MDHRIYFDHAATTPLDPRVRQAMEPYLKDAYGNPSSMHWAGREAHAAVDEARADVASLIGAQPGEIVFTGSGTEADNMALRGILERPRTEQLGAGDHLIVSAFEHPAVIETAKYLERRGVEVTYLEVPKNGVLTADTVAAALRSHTTLVSVMTANNVIGTIQPIHEIAELVHRHGAVFHTDAVQGAGKVPIDVTRTPIDLLSLSAHKLHGPKGVGALAVRRGTHLEPMLCGGPQERERRAGTENVPGIVGFGCAAREALQWLAGPGARDGQALRDLLETLVRAADPTAVVHAAEAPRLWNTSNIAFPRLEAEAILLALSERGVAASAGAACSSGSLEPSPVLLAMGIAPELAHGSVRFSLHRDSTEAEIRAAARQVTEAVSAVRASSSSAVRA